MAIKIGCTFAALRMLTLCQLTLSAMVLPRPPSSPNDIPRDSLLADSAKFRNDKTLYSLVQLNTNVEKPNTDGYRLLEIELRGAEEVDETNLQGLVRAMLSSGEENPQQQQQQQHPELEEDHSSYPNPEVIPHSILGVRDMGLSPNYRIRAFVGEEDKRSLLSPRRGVGNPDEKLYYLKSGRPKVDVNVRGHSGSFTSDSIISRTGSDQSSIIRPPDLHANRVGNTKSLLNNKRNRRPKKYQPPTSREYNNNDDNNKNYYNHSPSGRSFATGEYEPRPDRANEESTTENMAVTSSELPKQIPAPPSRMPSRMLVAQTTPVQKYALRRTDILPGYSFDEP